MCTSDLLRTRVKVILVDDFAPSLWRAAGLVLTLCSGRWYLKGLRLEDCVVCYVAATRQARRWSRGAAKAGDAARLCAAAAGSPAAASAAAAPAAVPHAPAHAAATTSAAGDLSVLPALPSVSSLCHPLAALCMNGRLRQKTWPSSARLCTC